MGTIYRYIISRNSENIGLVHVSRDKVLLDGGDYGRDDDGDEDEVFALQGIEDEDDGDVEMLSEDDILQETPSKSTKTTKAKNSKKRKKVANSSEEEPSDSEEETWGRGKSAYYASNAAELESEDEEGHELEEQEAKRLQAKGREGMADEDFGLDDDQDVEIPGAEKYVAIVHLLVISTKCHSELAEPAPAAVSFPQDKNLLVRHLEKTSPEALALARDWEETAYRILSTKEKLTRYVSRSAERSVCSVSSVCNPKTRATLLLAWCIYFIASTLNSVGAISDMAIQRRC